MKAFMKKLLVGILVSLLIAGGLLSVKNASVQAGQVIIAAVDSSSTWKSQAQVVCDGVADQVEINARLTSGNTVVLAPGTYQTSGSITPQSGSRLTGQGNGTLINLAGNAILVSNVSNVE